MTSSSKSGFCTETTESEDVTFKQGLEQRYYSGIKKGDDSKACILIQQC